MDKDEGGVVVVVEVEVESEGLRKSTKLAIAPEAVFALAGIILGEGSGSVYGMRKTGIDGVGLNPEYLQVAALRLRENETMVLRRSRVG